MGVWTLEILRRNHLVLPFPQDVVCGVGGVATGYTVERKRSTCSLSAVCWAGNKESTRNY